MKMAIDDTSPGLKIAIDDAAPGLKMAIDDEGCGQSAGLFDTTVISLSPDVYWPLQEPSGATAVDSMGNANGTYEIITVRGRPSLVRSDNTLAGVTINQGNWNSGSRIQSQNTIFDSQSFTFSVCLRREPGAVTGTICRRDSSSIADRQFYMDVATGGDTMSIAYSDFPTRDWVQSVATPLSGFGINLDDGEPHILTGVVEASTNRLEIWIDGVQVNNYAGSVGTVNTPTAGSYMSVGQGIYTGSPSVDGDVSHWIFWKPAISSTQIQQLHAAWDCQ